MRQPDVRRTKLHADSTADRLHGLPFGVKDQLCTAGVRTTLGSRIMTDWVPDHDATAIERLAAAGAILIGKENLHEFGKGK